MTSPTARTAPFAPTLFGLLGGLIFAPTARAEDSSWLDETKAEEQEKADSATKEDVSESIGAALMFKGVEIAWSGYGDVLLTYVPDGEFAFDTWHFNPIFNARMGEHLRAEAEFEYEHSGLEFKLEYAYLDYEVSRAAVFRSGVIMVPVGEYNDTQHPSFRWDQVKRPSVFNDVVPAVWSDVGLMFHGRAPVGEGNTLSYTAFVVNGLGGPTLDLTNDEVIRDMRGNYRENNKDKAVGGRVRLQARQDESVGNVLVSVSGYTGALLPDDTGRFSVTDLALAVGIGPVTVQGEGAVSFLDRGNGAGEYFESGAYLQLRTDVGKFTPVARYDWVKGHLGDTNAVVAGLNWHTTLFWSLRGEVRYPLGVEGAQPELYAMSSFFF